MYRSCLFYKCHPREGQSYPPGPYLYQLWKRKLWKDSFQKITSLAMYEKKKKGKRNPTYWIPIMCRALCRALWPVLTFLHAIMMRGRWFYYHLQIAKPRLRGGWVQTTKLEAGSAICTQDSLGSHSCIFRFQESEDKSYGFFSSYTANRKSSKMQLSSLGKQVSACFLVSSDSLSSPAWCRGSI